MKKAVASVLVLAAALTCLLGLSGCERTGVDDRSLNNPSVTGIDSGDISSNIGLEVSKKLNERNGKYVNMYVENNGSNSVVATINGQSERTFQAGEKGHVSVEVTQGFFGLDRDYAFKVVPGANGGAINIHYEIVQDLCDYSQDASR